MNKTIDIIHILKVGYTGDPYVGCTDINECAYYELNTCTGALYPRGFDIDVMTDKYEYDSIFLGDVEQDGYSQVLYLLK